MQRKLGLTSFMIIKWWQQRWSSNDDKIDIKIIIWVFVIIIKQVYTPEEKKAMGKAYKFLADMDQSFNGRVRPRWIFIIISIKEFHPSKRQITDYTSGIIFSFILRHCHKHNVELPSMPGSGQDGVIIILSYFLFLRRHKQHMTCLCRFRKKLRFWK